MINLSREEHIKVRILFVTIEIGAFRLSAIISANRLENRKHSFPVPLLEAKTRGLKDPFSICNTRLP